MFGGYCVCNKSKGQDRVLCCNENHTYGCFDGHKTERIAELCSSLFPDAVAETLRRPPSSESSLEEETRKTFRIVHNQIRKATKDRDYGGSTAILFCRVSETRAICANCGDSKGVLALKGKKTPRRLSVEHRPGTTKEKKRIESCGGQVDYGRICDVDGLGMLSVSRGFGNVSIPGFVSEPDVCEPINVADVDNQFVVLGSDGLFDAVSEHEVVDCVRTCLKSQGSRPDPWACADALVDLAMEYHERNGTEDDVSALVVLLNDLAKDAKAAAAIETDESVAFETPVKRRRKQD